MSGTTTKLLLAALAAASLAVAITSPAAVGHSTSAHADHAVLSFSPASEASGTSAWLLVPIGVAGSLAALLLVLRSRPAVVDGAPRSTTMGIAAGLATSGVLHGVEALPHWEEGWHLGAFFAASAGVLLALAIGTARAPSRLVLRLDLLVLVGLIGLYFAAREARLPLVAHVESYDAFGLATKVVEIAVACLVFHMLNKGGTLMSKVQRRSKATRLAVAGTLFAVMIGAAGAQLLKPARAASSLAPVYGVTNAIDSNPAPNVFETTLVADETRIALGDGVEVNAFTFNGTIPGPQIRVQVGDTVVVHFRNDLAENTGIHWHGIELNNASDGSSLSQNDVKPGGTFQYRFIASRPGVYWYHPHHSPSNQVHRGLYAPLIVTDQLPIIGFIFLVISFAGNTCLAQRGKHGAKTITSTVNVNEYTTLLSNASSGSTSIAVTSSTLNSNGYFPGTLAAGDLIFIIQVQGASMGLANDSTYGTINLYNNCGNYEFAQVSSVPNSTTITFDCALRNSYTASGKVQVVRVPRWTTLTINSGGTMTCPAWNGSTGGVVVVEVLGNTSINSGGAISATGRGFRGGALDNQSQFGTWDFRWNTGLSGAEKGEGIAGSQNDYDSFGGRYDRGAPANGGGGGNGHTSGGGGGGNAGNVASWNGYGVPDVSNGSWASAWNLEWSGFASNNSSGGGRGGYSYSSQDRNALVEGPGNTNWQGDNRRNVGGIGGRALDYSTGKLFFGGGGGSGDQNQNKGGAGANGGGLIYIMSFDDVAGGGQVVSNGSNGQSTPARGTDAAGGAGAGGTIVINATGSISGISINANGGTGGNQIIRNVFEPVEAEGTGGGGGGGYIAITNGAPARTANGGANGTTDSGGLLEFPHNGATRGGAGLPSQSFASYYLTAVGDTVCINTAATLTASIVGTAPFGVTYYWYSSATGGTSIGSGTTFITPPVSATTTYYVEICPGFYRVPVQVLLSPVPVLSFTASNVCLGDVMNFTNTSTGASSYTWDFGDGSGTSSATNPSHTYTTANSFVVTLIATNSAGCSDTITQTVIVSTDPQVSFTSTGATTGCGSLTVNFVNNTTGGGGNTYTWNFGDGTGTSSQQNPSHTYNTPGTYTVTLGAVLGTCNDIDSIVNYITVNPAPTAGFTSTNVCLGDVMNFTNTSAGATGYSWDFGDGTGTSSSTNPTYTYATANTFTVTLIATDGTCTDTITQSVTVNNAPQVSFTSTGATTGCGSLTVNFVNNTTGGGGNTYTWDFGDGSATTSQQNPTYTYTTPGTYTVTLAAALGTCNDIDSIVNYITVNPAPTAGFTSTNVCLGDVMNFTNTSAGATGYSWDFGDGTGTSSSTNPTYTYATANTFTVTLIATDGTCTDTITQSVTVNNAPQVSFTSTGATTGCGSLTVNFVNNTTGGGGNTYTWNFGDGTGTSSQQNPSHTYNTPGTYTVTLGAVLGTCNDIDSIVNYITVNPAPTAGFTSTNVCLGDVMNFTNTSAGATGYSWDFGDGTGTSSSTNPTYTYATANTFTVTLIATDGTCTDTITQSVTVNNAPQVSFTSTGATTGCGSLTVNFVNNTTGGGGNTYTWDFGDGSATTSQQNPTYTYTTPGTYTVTLAAALGTCNDIDSIVNYITVNPAPTAGFTSTNVCLGDVMNFTNTSAGATGYSWDFGDGTGTSSSTNPTYTYATANTFTVTLIATDGTCTDTITQSVTVNNAPQVSFTSTGATTGCGSLTVNFVNNTTGGGGNTYTWNFGDGTGTSSQQNPSHTYNTPGTYTVTLAAALGTCNDIDSIVNYITVNPAPTAGFTSTNVCLGDVMNFTNTSAGATGYSWDFGDGTGTSSSTNPTYTYATANTFTVTLIATDGTCTDTITQSVTVNNAPQVSFTSTGATTGCGSLTVNFVNNTTGGGGNTYTWDFGDGSATSSQQNPTYTYTIPGTYTVTLTAAIGSCVDVDSIVNYITVTPGPVASFMAGSVCLGETVHFTNTSTGATSYLWDFGDGTGTSTLQNPTHVYTLGNTFTITLISSDGSCADTITQTVTVNPAPVVLFSASATTACDSLTVVFTNNTTGAASYNWDFGDGFFSTDVNPIHTYNVPGIYSVTLNEILGICISSQTSIGLISIYETPHVTVSASQTILCPNDCVNFTSTSTGSPNMWAWNFPGASTSISSAENPLNICYPSTGTFTVVLTVSNDNCSSSQTLTNFITVNTCTSPSANFYASDTVLCKGSCISFTSTSQNASTYEWLFPGASPSSSSQPNPNNICYPSSGTYDVTLIVSNGTLYDTLVLTSFIQVAAAPAPPVFSQNGDTLTASAGVTYQWFFNSFQISGATNQSHIALASGYYSVTTTDINGCPATSQQSWISLIGVEEIGDITLLYIYPNPVSSMLTLMIETRQRHRLHVEMMDAIGKEIFTEEVTLTSSPFKKEFDLGGLAPGIYFISIESGDQKL